MRDLTSRLRSVVQQNVRGRRTTPDVDLSAPGVPAGELTYVPDIGTTGLDLDVTAAALGGARYAARNSACVALDRAWSLEQWHGSRRVESYAIDAAAQIQLFDPRVVDPNWASNLVFFDIETTGLSGGAGTLAFLAGCGWFDEGGFRVRQFFLNGPGGEHAMLDGLAGIFDRASLLVTFNGKAFDVPVMENRWAFHRRDTPTGDLPHFDMLPAARRLWGQKGDAGRSARTDQSETMPGVASTCTLTALERSVLRFHRIGDVPGFEIPSRYFHFLRTGDTRAIQSVLEHNRLDVISLAAVMSRALGLAADGPEGCETGGEQLGLGRLYERAGDRLRAIRAFKLAAASGPAEVATHALARLAVVLRRQQRHEESAAVWRQVLASSSELPLRLDRLERVAAEALAIHHEHRARDLAAAKGYAEALRAQARGRFAAEVDHRLGRLDRKMKELRNSPAAVQLRLP